MKLLILFTAAGLYLALLGSGIGIFVHSTTYTQANGAKFLRCTYVKATAIETRHLPLSGRLGVKCPHKI